jgi:hypothetical protein
VSILSLLIKYGIVSIMIMIEVIITRKKVIFKGALYNMIVTFYFIIIIYYRL